MASRARANRSNPPVPSSCDCPAAQIPCNDASPASLLADGASVLPAPGDYLGDEHLLQLVEELNPEDLPDAIAQQSAFLALLKAKAARAGVFVHLCLTGATPSLN
jgi:hypothetical protein